MLAIDPFIRAKGDHEMTANSNRLHVMGISGSLSQGSYNSAFLRTATELMPPGMTLEIFDLSPLPIFNADHEKQFPEAVVEFRTRLAQANAPLVATPENNSSISGALKNAIDWASRSPQQPLNGKPVAMIGASTGNFGTLRAQLHLRQILTHVGVLPLGKPEVLVARAEQVFDAERNLVDEAARGFLRDLLTALAGWIQRVSLA
jgi:chromate reductase